MDKQAFQFERVVLFGRRYEFRHLVSLLLTFTESGGITWLIAW
jgi:hypothetical protein